MRSHLLGAEYLACHRDMTQLMGCYDCYKHRPTVHKPTHPVTHRHLQGWQPGESSKDAYLREWDGSAAKV